MSDAAVASEATAPATPAKKPKASAGAGGAAAKKPKAKPTHPKTS
ncbi:jg4495, partial [Pararge aegeria aegeria]